MHNLYSRFFASIAQFRKLPIADLFPNVTKNEVTILGAIAHAKQETPEEPLKISELAGLMHVTVPAVSRGLKSMEQKGLVERTVNTEDRRNTYVHLTPAGEQRLHECEEVMGAFGEACVRRMNREDMEHLIAYLDELYQISETEILIQKKKKGKQEHE